MGAVTPPNTYPIYHSFHYILTEMSTLSPEKLQLLANFFQLQVAKYNNTLATSRLISLGFAGTGIVLGATAIGLRNENHQAIFFIAGITMLALGGLTSLAQISNRAARNGHLAWYNRCIEFIQLQEQTG